MPDVHGGMRGTMGHRALDSFGGGRILPLWKGVQPGEEGSPIPGHQGASDFSIRTTGISTFLLVRACRLISFHPNPA